jgi:glycosyltransferase involved in cell wall biosynthesis
VGDGDARAELERLSREWGIAGSVRFEGWRSNVVQYLSAADIFAASSISEGTHLALGEAMAAGLPVVATPVGGARDYVSENTNGLLFPVGDYRALAACLERLASDAPLRERMGRAAAVAARATLEQGETARRHIELLFARTHRPHGPARIRVMHLVATLDRGGTERQLAQLAVRMDKARFDNEVICLTRGGPTSALLEAGGIPYKVIGKKNRFAFLALISLIRRLFAKPPHVLHTWLFTSNVYGRIAGLVAGADNIVSSERSTDPWKSRWYRTIDRCLATGTRFIVANSASVARSLVAAGIPRPQIRVIPNGVDADTFRPTPAGDARLALGLAAGGRWFGYIGRLAFEKRPEVFLKVSESVLARMGEAHAVFFGEGPMLETLRSQAARLKDCLVFFGDTPRVELAHAALDCLVLTSKWEGFPNVILEAMATGRAVVAVRMPATEELVVDGETGLLVDDDPEALAAAVIRLLQDAKLSEEMGRKGRERVLRRYSLDKMVRAYEELYFETVRGRGNHGVTY